MPALVQSVDGGFNFGPSQTTNPTAFGSNNTSGNLLVAFVWWIGNGSWTASSVTDTIGNTWILIPGTFSHVASVTYTNAWCQLAYCANCKGGANTVTGNFTSGGTGGPSYAYIALAEFSGVTNLDKVTTNSVTSVGSLIQLGTVVPTQNNEVIVGVVFADNSAGIGTPGSGFTGITSDQTGAASYGMQYQIQTTAVSVSPTYSAGSSTSDYCSCIATFSFPVAPSNVVPFVNQEYTWGGGDGW